MLCGCLDSGNRSLSLNFCLFCRNKKMGIFVHKLIFKIITSGWYPNHEAYLFPTHTPTHTSASIDAALQTNSPPQDVIYPKKCHRFRCALLYRELFIRFLHKINFAYRYIAFMNALLDNDIKQNVTRPCRCCSNYISFSF